MPDNVDIVDLLLEIPGTVNLGEGIVLEPEGYKIKAALQGGEDSAQDSVVMLAFEVEHSELLPAMLTDFSVGFGKNQIEALRDAIKVWAAGALTVLQHLYKNQRNCGLVEEMEMTSLTEEKVPIVWNLIRGPLQGIGLERENVPKGTDDMNSMLHVMLNAITGELHLNKKIWIRAVVTRINEEISGECYLNNEPWEEGLSALYYWAESWGDCRELQTRRQFIICDPTDKEPTATAVANLKQQIAGREKKEKPKKWWQFWKR